MVPRYIYRERRYQLIFLRLAMILSLCVILWINYYLVENSAVHLFSDKIPTYLFVLLFFFT